MSTNTSTTELLRMTPQELRQEIALHRSEYAKMRMGVEIQKEKNHALYKVKRREIARMKTVLTGMERNATNPKKPTKNLAADSSESLASSVSSVSSKKPSQAKKKPVKVPRSK